MPIEAMTYDITFRDFQFLQSYMARRLFAKNRRAYGIALTGVVVCAMLLAMAVFANIRPYRFSAIFSSIAPYPLSFYLFLIFCLVVALLCLLPAVNLRMKMLRMQVSNDSPFLGATKLIVEPDGLIVDRAAIKSKYLWAAFQGVELSKNAVILPIDNGIGVIIPATAFASDTARYEFAAAISKRLEEQKRGVP
jgi:hypothetical protein